MKCDFTSAQALKADWKRLAKFASRSLRAFASLLTHFDLVQFSFAHHPGQPEQQTVVVSSWVIDSFGIGDQRAEDRAEIKQAIPITIVAREATGFNRQYQPELRQADLRHQLLKAAPQVGPGP